MTFLPLLSDRYKGTKAPPGIKVEVISDGNYVPKKCIGYTLVDDGTLTLVAFIEAESVANGATGQNLNRLGWKGIGGAIGTWYVSRECLAIIDDSSDGVAVVAPLFEKHPGLQHLAREAGVSIEGLSSSSPAEGKNPEVEELVSEGGDEDDEDDEDEDEDEDEDDEPYGTCDCCGESIEHEDDAHSVVVEIVHDVNGRVAFNFDTFCGHCYEHDTFFCCVSEELYWDNKFESINDQDDDTVCLEYVEQTDTHARAADQENDDLVYVFSLREYDAADDEDRARWTADFRRYCELNPDYTPSIKVRQTIKFTEESAPMASYADFYWKVPTDSKAKPPAYGDLRRLHLMDKDGNATGLSAADAVAAEIFARIDEAGADRGDPHVLNTYTRLVLIEKSLLPKDYKL